MSDKMDMSLDDIIGQNKSQFQFSASRPRGRGQRGRKMLREGFQPPQSRQKRDRPLPSTKASRISEKWRHDMFDRAYQKPRISTGVTELEIANLHYNVSDNDIKILFEEFGPLRKAAVQYDRSGRSVGRATVVFERRGDALKAMKHYNRKPLDGRCIKIRIVSPQKPYSNRGTNKRSEGFVDRDSGRGAGSSSRAFSVRPSPGRGSGSGSSEFLAKRDRREGVTRDNRRRVPTAEELDAELEAYVGKKKLSASTSSEAFMPNHGPDPEAGSNSTKFSSRGRDRRVDTQDNWRRVPTAEELDVELEAYMEKEGTSA